MIRILFFIIVSSSLLGACRSQLTETPKAPVVVRGYLSVGDPVDSIYLENVLTSREFESVKNVPIETAEVELRSGELVIPLFPDPIREGYYIGDAGYKVQPATDYTLIVKYDGQSISATCSVPDTLKLASGSSVQDVIQVGTNSEDGVLSLSWEEQIGFEYLLDLKVEEENLIPLVSSASKGDFEKFFSKPSLDAFADLKESHFKYRGKHKLTIHTISPEYSDYVNYLPTSFDRNLYNAPNNIINGYGVFAGLASTSFEFTLVE